MELKEKYANRTLEYVDQLLEVFKRDFEKASKIMYDLTNETGIIFGNQLKEP